MSWAPASPAVHEDELTRIAAPLLRIPYEYRRYHVTAAQAQALHGIEPSVCERLARLGLPHVGQGPDALFDDNDLATVSLYLRLHSVRRSTMRLWLKTLSRLGSRATTYSVDIQVSCPTPWHDGDCAYRVLVGEEEHREVVVGERRGSVATLRVDVAEPPFPVPPPLRGLLAEFADVDFYLLPFPLRDSQDFLTTVRAGHCSLFARTFVDEARRRGFEARMAYGLIVSAPFSQLHNWAEVAMDGRWVKVDPLTPRFLHAFGVCDETEWPQSLSPAGLFHRISEAGPLVSHTWLACPVSLPTRVPT